MSHILKRSQRERLAEAAPMWRVAGVSIKTNLLDRVRYQMQYRSASRRTCFEPHFTSSASRQIGVCVI